MYLSKLKLNGFKSFADDTRLDFDQGVTAIVGPNGCGKSNIVDAIRWVIGEQRPTALRSQKMENVIFNGTEKRRPVGMSEVELTIENNRGVLPTEYTEVSIGRRLFRSGDSEYLMNGTQCRLKDITELFMDTGMGADAYSVIELKMIDEILSDSAQDRRRLFEEAAGITRYKQRRRQSLRKLENTHADLTRIRDLTDEVAKNVRRLKRQAGKARKFNRLREKLRRLGLHLARATFDRLQEQRSSVVTRQAALHKKLEAREIRASETEERLKRLKEGFTRKQQMVTEREKSLQQHRDEARDLESDIRLHTERIQTARREVERLEQEEGAAQEQRTDLEQLRDRLVEQQEAAAPALQKAETRLQEAREKWDTAQLGVNSRRETVRQHQRHAREAEQQLASVKREIDRVANRIELHAEEKDRAEQRLEKLDAEAGSLSEQLDEARHQHAAIAELTEGAKRKLEHSEERRKTLREELDGAKDTLRTRERERDATEAEVQLLESLVSSYEEFPDAVRLLAEAESGSGGRLRTVADVLACDEEHQVALETALGDLASCIVVSYQSEAARAMEYLRHTGEGQATFVILNQLPSGSGVVSETSANLVALRDVVRAPDEGCAALADLLLRDAFLAPSLDEALGQAAQSEEIRRFITPEGEWVDTRGVVQGGSRREQPSAVGSRIGRQEQLEHAREQLAVREQQLAEQEERVDELRGAVSSVPVDKHRRAVDSAREQLHEARQAVEQSRYARKSHEARRSEFTARIEELQSELAELRKKESGLQQKLESLVHRHAAVRENLEGAEEQLAESEQLQREAMDEHNEARVDAVEARNRAAILKKDLSRATERLQMIERRGERREAEMHDRQKTIQESEEKRRSSSEELDDLREKRPTQEKLVRKAREQLQELGASIEKTEAQLKELREQRENHLTAKNELAVQLAEMDTRLAELRGRMADDYDRPLEDLTSPPDDFDVDSAGQEIKSLKQKVSRLGEVNPLAVEEYEEEKERLDFLTEQQEDLKAAEETLLATITEINQTAAQRFDETFAAIQKSFAGLFERLFGEGASARLSLVDADDPLESDVEIMAQPRGKKPSVLSQLSSGEKTLTAIALLFAIYLVKPSPFCVLDEVDAPLDDTNVERFMNLIRDFVTDTQFILVTHNKQTMAMADRMYGITMQEQGVSTIVSVEFDEATELAEA